MKLRIRAHTLRLRLTRSEVDAIGRGEAVTETTPFPDGSVFTYSLVPAGAAVTAILERSEAGSRMVVQVPVAAARDWARSDAVGFDGENAIEVGPMHILIEKDFACLAPRPGDEGIDTFPNPAT